LTVSAASAVNMNALFARVAFGAGAAGAA